MSYSFKIPLCPHCSIGSSVYVNERIYGWEYRTWYPNSETGDLETEANYDNVHCVESKTIRCCDCGKIRRDLKRLEGGIASNN